MFYWTGVPLFTQLAASADERTTPVWSAQKVRRPKASPLGVAINWKRDAGEAVHPETVKL